MITADRAFEECANTFAAFASHPPPYVAYHEAVVLDSKALRINREYRDRVIRKSADGSVALRLDASPDHLYRGPGGLVRRHSTPCQDFKVTGFLRGGGAFSMRIFDVEPLHYDLLPKPGIDTVAVALRRYRTRFVDDPGAPAWILHVHLDASGADTNITPRMFFKELYLDQRTMLPTRVEFVGPDERVFNVDYTVVDGQPMVKGFRFAQTLS